MSIDQNIEKHFFVCHKCNRKIQAKSYKEGEACPSCPKCNIVMDHHVTHYIPKDEKHFFVCTKCHRKIQDKSYKEGNPYPTCPKCNVEMEHHVTHYITSDEV